MRPTAPDASEIAAGLRRAFDRSFADPPRPGIGATDDFLAIRVGEDPYALRVSEISGVAKAPRIVPVPGRRADCLGVAGLGGAGVPVFSLARLLGYRGDGDPAAWLVLCGADKSLALAFGAIEGYRRVARSEIVAAPPEAGARRPASRAVRLDGRLRGIIELSSIVEAVKAGADPPRLPGAE